MFGGNHRGGDSSMAAGGVRESLDLEYMPKHRYASTYFPHVPLLCVLVAPSARAEHHTFGGSTHS